MSTKATSGQVSFDCQQLIFGAFDSTTGMLILVVEAFTDVQALARVDSVAPLLGLRGVCELLVVQLEQLQPDVPTFLKSFFEGEKVGFDRVNVAPGTSTLQ